MASEDGDVVNVQRHKERTFIEDLRESALKLRQSSNSSTEKKEDGADGMDVEERGKQQGHYLSLLEKYDTKMFTAEVLRSTKLGKVLQKLYKKSERVDGRGAVSDALAERAKNLVTQFKDKKEWAVKVIDKSKCSKEELKDILWEAEALKIVQHDYVTEMKEFIDGDHFIYIVMEIMRGGELFDRIVERGFYSEAMARDAVRTMCIGLDHCHKNGVIHLDMKPENVLYADTSEESALKLCDFGIAKRCPPDGFLLGDGQLHGTPGYISPEMIRKEKYDGKTDVWAIGVITYILLGGVPPFDEPPDLVDTPEGQLEL